MQKDFTVGVAGCEPAASCSQSRRDNRATLHPVAGRKYRTNFYKYKLQIANNRVLFKDSQNI